MKATRRSQPNGALSAMLRGNVYSGITRVEELVMGNTG